MKRILIVAVLLALCSCSNDSAPIVDAEDTSVTGVIVHRRIDPEHTKRTCVKRKNSNPNSKCTKHKNTVSDDRDFLLLVKSGDGNEIWVDVDQAKYDSKNTGDPYP